MFRGVFARGSAIIDDRAWLQALLDTEAGLARALERAGLAPAGAGEAVTRAARASDFDIAELGELSALTGNPVPGLARALVLKPRLLLIDEPSSGLDRITASEIDDLLLEVKKDSQTTMIIVTHDVHGARRVGDKMAVLDKGRLVGFGTADELQGSDNEVVRNLVSES